MSTTKYEQVEQLVSRLLTEPPKCHDWENRYNGYAKEIIGKKPILERVQNCFRQWSPLCVYSKISDITGAATKRKVRIDYDLRFHGQSVATIMVENGNVFLMETKEQRANTNEHFTRFTSETFRKKWETREWLEKMKWDSKEARNFRKFFRGLEGKGALPEDKQHGEFKEHFYESMLLVEFAKKKGEKKSLANIQPVKLLDKAFFQMPTSLRASDSDNIECEKKEGRGGGIDIMSRVGRGGAAKLCIMELKDENIKKERPEKVMQQAVAYAVFIAHLLRSNSGDKWYNIFGFNKKNPEKGVPRDLTLIAAVVMPDDGVTPDFKEYPPLELNELNTTIMLRSLYFDPKTSGKPGGFKFSGSLKGMLV